MFRLNTKSEQAGSGVKIVFRHFWPYTRGSRRLLLSGGLLIAAEACEVATIWLFGVITGEVLAKGDLGAFWTPAVSWLGLAAVTGAFTFGGHYLTALAGERFLFRLRDNLFAHTQRLSPDFFDQRRLGDLMARMTSDVEAVEQLVASGVAELATSGVTVLFFTVAVLLVRWDLALVSFAAAPLFLLTTRAFTQPWVVYGAVSELERAVTNLLDNAVKFSPATAAVRVTLCDGALVVEDQGPGIMEKDLPHVFERFYRSNAARTLPGSRLGLAIVSHAAKRHRGRVTAENRPEAGARLRMVLPGWPLPRDPGVPIVL